MTSLLDIVNKKPPEDSKEEKLDLSKIVFISDCAFDKNPLVAQNVLRHMKITEYSSQFVNRDLHSLFDKGCTSIYLNVRDKDQKIWLKKEVLSPNITRDFTVVGVYSKSTGQHQDWLDQLKHDMKICYDKLQNIRALNKDDFVQEIVALGVKLADPIFHKFLACLCSKKN